LTIPSPKKGVKGLGFPAKWYLSQRHITQKPMNEMGDRSIIGKSEHVIITQSSNGHFANPSNPLKTVISNFA
jgi:hypothetical protein